MKVCSTCHRCYDDSIEWCAEQDHSELTQTREGGCDHIAGYRLEVLIDTGKRGETYRAVQTECGQPCQITIRSTDAQRADQFVRETETAATLFHAGVADIYEVGTLNIGDVFVVVEDPQGRTVREVLDNDGPPPLLETVEVVRQAAESLHVLHQKGLLHRALRPENILLTRDLDDRLLVRLQHLDFGGAAQHAIVSNKFTIDSALDSLVYFAPEQSSSEEATAQTDIYSLGIVFYEMLAGTPPFEAAKATALIAKHRNQPPPDIRIDNFDLRMLVTHALMESLNKRPDSRQTTADLFARQLRHIEQLATHTSTPAPILDAAPTSAKLLPRKVVVAPDIDILAGIAAKHVPVPKPSAVLYREPESAYIDTPTVEQPVFISQPSEPFHSAVHEQRTKIEWQPLDDDIPTLEDLMETLGSDQNERIEPACVDTASVGQPIYIPPPLVAVQMERTKVEWEPLDDDIPTLEDVMESLAGEQEEEPAFEVLAPAEAVIVPVVSVPEPKEWKPFEPAVTPPVVAVAVEAPMAQRQTVKPPMVKEPIVATPIVELEPEPEEEEITIVKPPKRIKIEWAQPVAPTFQTYEKFSPRRPTEVNFYPTLLGGASNTMAIEAATADSMFSAYNLSRGLSIPYRPLMIGCGFLVLVAFFLFGSGRVGSFVQTPVREDPVATATTSEQKSLPPTVQTSAVVKPQKPIVQTLAEPVQNAKVEERTKTVQNKHDAPTPAEKPKPAPVRTNPKPSLTPSTLVISTDKGTVTSKTEPTNPASGTTRPRVVRDPQ